MKARMLWLPLLAVAVVLIPCAAEITGQPAQRTASAEQAPEEVPCTVDIEALRARAAAEGWTFTVGENPATRYTLDQLCGLVEPEGWRETAKFVTITPQLELPSYFDWRDTGDCTPVRNQGACGSCWAFGTVGPLESNILIKDEIEVDLSEQWLLSCNRDGYGCWGGWWVHDYHEWKTDPCGDNGAVYEADFPYTATEEPCDCPYPHIYWINDWAYIDTRYTVPTVAEIKQAIMDYGPVSAAVCANSAFHAYTGGIFSGPTCTDINHGVVLVGWDDNQGTNGVWFLRNSWGPGWGEGGYMRIEYGVSLIGYAACYIDYAGSRVLTVHANYIGFNYPNGHPSPELNQVPVTIDGVPYTTPVEMLVVPGDTLTVETPGWAELYFDEGYFGTGPYDRWSDGGAQTHEVTITGDTTLTVYYDPDVISTRGCCGIADAVEDWALDGDTVLVSPGTHYIDSGDTPIMIARSTTLISETGRTSTTLSMGGCTDIIQCDDVSGVTIGDVGHGFTFKPTGGIGDYIAAEYCDNVHIVDNDFNDGGVAQYRDIDGGVSVSRCRDVEITSNRFPYGWLHAINAFSDTNLTVASNTVYYDWDIEGTQRRGEPRIRLSSCRDAGIYSNTLIRNETEAFPGIKLSSCSGDIVIGGDLDHGNKLPYAYVYVFGSAPLRIDGECNYWGWSNYDDLNSILGYWSQGHLDLVPWANSSLTLTYVPFDGDRTTVAAPDSAAVCPAGDFESMVVTLTVRDGGNDPVEDMWCDDVEIEWADEHPEDPSFEAPDPCESKTLFDEKTTDANGRASADWSEMGGCGTITVSAIEDIPLANPGVAFVNSPDFNADGNVNLSDFAIFGGIYITDDICGDFNRDGSVGLSDFAAFATHYSHSCPEAMGAGYVADLESDTGGWSRVRLLAPSDEVRVADPSYTSDVTVLADLGSHRELLGLEVLVSYDKRSARPLSWEGGTALYIMTLETMPEGDASRGWVRIASVAAEPVASGPGECIGTLRFAVDDPGVILEARVESVKGLTAEHELIDLTGSTVSPDGRDVPAAREYVLAPMLDLRRNPSAETVSLRFGAPISQARHLKVDLYDVTGRLVCRVYDGPNDGVAHTAEIGLGGEGIKVASPGVYFVRLYIDGRSLDTQKVVLLK